MFSREWVAITGGTLGCYNLKKECYWCLRGRDQGHCLTISILGTTENYLVWKVNGSSLLHRPEGLSWIPRTHIRKKNARYSNVLLKSQHWGDRDRLTPGTWWPASIENWQVPGKSERPCLKESRWTVSWGTTPEVGPELLFTYSCTHMHLYLCTCMHTYMTHTKSKTERSCSTCVEKI